MELSRIDYERSLQWFRLPSTKEQRTTPHLHVTLAPLVPVTRFPIVPRHLRTQHSRLPLIRFTFTCDIVHLLTFTPHIVHLLSRDLHVILSS